jgi:single-strand DNA-binding protein
MNNLKNKVQLIGHLGVDPEIKIFSSGKKLAKLSLATSEQYKDAEGKKVSETQWHNLVIWGKSADVAEKYLKKGSEIAVDGKITYRTYELKDGEKRYATEILVNDFLMLGKKN